MSKLNPHRSGKGFVSSYILSIPKKLLKEAGFIDKDDNVIFDYEAVITKQGKLIINKKEIETKEG